jgi:hypothetical protein
LCHWPAPAWRLRNTTTTDPQAPTRLDEGKCWERSPGTNADYAADTPGDDIHNWKELLTELSYPKPRGIHKPEEMLDRLKAVREKECSSSTVWNVIEEDENSITYEWHFQKCLDQPEQCEIAKILVGKSKQKLQDAVPKSPTRFGCIFRGGSGSIDRYATAIVM